MRVLVAMTRGPGAIQRLCFPKTIHGGRLGHLALQAKRGAPRFTSIQIRPSLGLMIWNAAPRDFSSARFVPHVCYLSNFFF
jgi:hypothetical protein